MNDKDVFLEVLLEDDFVNFIDDLREVIALLSNNELTKEHLQKVVYSYDHYGMYHMLFELFGHEMEKDEYLAFKKRYGETFDLTIVPLPDCCLELDEKWGV